MFNFSQGRRRGGFRGGFHGGGNRRDLPRQYDNKDNKIMENTDFRKISTLPTVEELVYSKEVALKPNIVDGPYKSVDQYLDIHFRLFREDFVAPLRKTIQILRRNPNFSPPDIKVYRNVLFLGPPTEIYNKYHHEHCFCDDTVTMICFDPDNRRNKQVDDLEKSKMFMPGSLLCFTQDNFHNITFFIVKCRERKHLVDSQIAIQPCGLVRPSFYRSGSFMMIESEAFYEPYSQVLRALQDMDEDNFPFPQYIIKVQEADALPRYLRYRKSVPISIYGIDKDYCFDVLNPSDWPTAAQLGVNDSQFRALETALTKELAVIQGPPGTGKTFMAMKITETFIRNSDMMRRRAPILVICMTNHALDQFLLGMLKFTTSIVRYGGQSKCRELDQYNFLKLGLTRDVRLENMKSKEVIGLTTTGAARIRHMLQDLNCEIVIVEEAAEILEAHVVASITKCQHLILIGDHKQLQPKIAEFKLTNYKLNISLFERMVMNRDKCATLEVQHRMAPEMTKLIVPLIYKTLKDHESVLQKPAVKSLTKRVSFVTHSKPESQFKKGHSKMNEYEASFVVALCKHLLKQDGYTPEDITILTTYKGQLFYINDLIKSDNSEQACELADVRVAVVDDYQGEECNIILLSLVRSNQDGNIGFLANENRANVALSRAKIGLVMVGNMETLSCKAEVWKSIKKSLEDQDALDRCLAFRCEAHPDCTFEAWQSTDFEKLAPLGGCNENNCLKVMDCGHICKAKCHTDSSSHNICMDPCKLRCHKCRMNHICSNKCSEKCERQCFNLVIAIRQCGHSIWKLCYKDFCDTICKAVCRKKLSCGHVCQKMCHKTCLPCEQCGVDSLNFDTFGI